MIFLKIIIHNNNSVVINTDYDNVHIYLTFLFRKKIRNIFLNKLSDALCTKR